MCWFSRRIGISWTGKIDNRRIEHDHFRWIEPDSTGVEKFQINKLVLRYQNQLIAKRSSWKRWMHQRITITDFIDQYEY